METLPCGQHLSRQGAVILSETLSKLYVTGETLEKVNAMAENLGLVRIGKVGGIYNFDAKNHEAQNADIVKYQKCRIVRSGWWWNYNDAVLRAEVVPWEKKSVTYDQQEPDLDAHKEVRKWMKRNFSVSVEETTNP